MLMNKPAMLALVAVGALWFYSRRAAAAPATAAAMAAARKLPTDPGRIDRTSTYANPQTMAELLSRSVMPMLTGILPKMPAGAAQNIGTADARAALRAAEAPGYYGWSGPVVSAVDPASKAEYTGDPYFGGDMVDSIPAGPVYDISTDFVANPFGLANF